MYVLTCQECGKTFEASRIDAKFDCVECRKKASNRRKSHRRWEADAIDTIIALGTWVNNPIHGEDAMNSLKNIFQASMNTLAEAKGIQHVNDDWWMMIDKAGQLQLVEIKSVNENRSHDTES